MWLTGYLRASALHFFVKYVGVILIEGYLQGEMSAGHSQQDTQCIVKSEQSKSIEATCHLRFICVICDRIEL